MVDPIHSTSSAVQIYHHLTSESVEIPNFTITENSSSIGKEPVSKRSPCATSTCYTEQGIIIFTNVLQCHKTVVLVCCIVEWEPDIPCTWSEQTSVPYMKTGSISKVCLKEDSSFTYVPPLQHICMAHWWLPWLWDWTIVMHHQKLAVPVETKRHQSNLHCHWWQGMTNISLYTASKENWAVACKQGLVLSCVHICKNIQYRKTHPAHPM